MESCSFSKTQKDRIGILSVKGYYNAEAAKEAQRYIDEFLGQGIIHIIIDFTQCPSINSPGTASLLDTCLKITDDFRGVLVLTGLNQVKKNFFTMAGILPIALTATSIEEALPFFPKKV